MKKMTQKENAGHGLIALANRGALALVVNSVNATCQSWHHQPKVPEEARKYRKF